MKEFNAEQARELARKVPTAGIMKRILRQIERRARRGDNQVSIRKIVPIIVHEKLRAMGYDVIIPNSSLFPHTGYFFIVSWRIDKQD